MYFTVQTCHFIVLKKTNHLFITTVLLFASHFCFSQFNSDSIKKAILLMPNDTASIYKIIAIGIKARKEDNSLALDIFKMAEKKYGEKNTDSIAGIIYTQLAHITPWLGHSSESMSYYLKTKQIGERLKVNVFIATGYSGIALVYHNNKDYKTAIDFYEKATTSPFIRHRLFGFPGGSRPKLPDRRYRHG